ncbi:hypothetical protein HNO86_09770 [Pseudomonas sp. C1C7]|uniref:hypothetical protein n=1 Tax=Pseudomonas sp. C1C7 TaxID=2735272 RepID=UPI0015861E08|nr:hypothetical protein [Pseudomonas sp. C1C7]NUT75329.1 hypothetical protein [Pseudomonas sp. C1C7]
MNVYFSNQSMRSDPYLIKNPLETTNSFTKTNVDDAVDALKLKSNSELSLEDIKETLKKYDFTSISTKELAEVGSLLFKNSLIGGVVAHFFTSGRMAYDDAGLPAGTDVKFNAVALFNEMLDDRLTHKRTEAEGFHELTRNLTQANHILGALSYFVNSPQGDISVNIEA